MKVEFGMSKSLYIAEKPSVAREFAKALKCSFSNHDGYMEAEKAVVTWCVGHLITMSYPEAYGTEYKRWSLSTLPFLPSEFKYEVIPGVSKQFAIVKELLNRKDVDTIYVCTDSGREGEYIYRLVEQMAEVKGKNRKRVWIDSQTEEEILRGIEKAKDLSAYDNLGASAYLRAKEDYLMGINFSRLLTLKYGDTISGYLKRKRTVIAVGRVMTCVLGMVVRREREIRSFEKTNFYRIIAGLGIEDMVLEGEWKRIEGSLYEKSDKIYKDNGFFDEKEAERFIAYLQEDQDPVMAEVLTVDKKKETKNPPLLFNLAELQNECSKLFKINPDETLKIVQELYEKKMVTYPRTDARVLSTAVAKVIDKNIKGLLSYPAAAKEAKLILEKGNYKTIHKTRYVNDKLITDHYAIIPTGQGFQNLKNLVSLTAKVYEVITRRFLSIFYPPAVYQKLNICFMIKKEAFYASSRILKEEGYLAVMNASSSDSSADKEEKEGGNFTLLQKVKKNQQYPVNRLYTKEGETSPPKRYNSGSIILAMENAGQLIEDEELRAQIKGSGIGTSATRAEILKKLITIQYLNLNKKTQIITPSLLGEMIYDVVNMSIRSLLNPDLTASWEKGLTYVAEGKITDEEYMEKLKNFVSQKTEAVKHLYNNGQLKRNFEYNGNFYGR